VKSACDVWVHAMDVTHRVASVSLRQLRLVFVATFQFLFRVISSPAFDLFRCFYFFCEEMSQLLRYLLTLAQQLFFFAFLEHIILAKINFNGCP